MNDRVEIAAPPMEIAAPRPEPPRPEDCCGSGCVHCIYAIYDDALLAWQREVARIRERDAKPI